MSSNTKRVLIVEDQVNWQRLLQAILTPLQYATRIAGNLVEADTFLQQERFDVIIVDLFLEGDNPNNLSGLTLLDHIQTNYPDLPRIILTGMPPEGSALSQFGRFGVHDVLMKANFDRASFLNSVNNAITQSPRARATQPSVPIANPYIAGNPIRAENATVFLGRQDIAQTILEEIRKGTQRPSMLLYGRRRMGKTSALYHLRRLVKDISFVEALKFIDVYIDAQSASAHTDVDFCYQLVKTTIKQLHEVMLIDTEALSRDGFFERQTFGQNPVGRLSEFFEVCDSIMESADYYCVVAIDEYEEIDTHINLAATGYHRKGLSRELLLELRHILQHHSRFMFLFAGTHYLRDLSTVNWSEIFINVKTLHISFLNPKAGYDLLTQPVPELGYEDDQLIQNILDMTGCQPFLLQAIASELIRLLNLKHQRMVEREILDKAVSAVLTNWNTYFDYLWGTECSSPRHQKFLQIIASKEAQFSEHRFPDYEDELKDLIRKEILKIEHGYITLTMPILKEWMKRNKYIL